MYKPSVNTHTPDQYGKVAVLLGGDSAEREVSLNSGNAVLNALLRQGVDAFAFDPAERPLTDLIELKVDRALIMLHGRGGEDGSMQGALQLLKIPYTGSRVLGSALAMDKIHTKQVWQSLGLPTAKYEIADKRHFEAGKCSAIMDKLGNEVMVKPAREGSSIGMARVTSAKQLEAAI
ncbi:MAG: D-alanine--D-alanine ligase, partial [Pseudomonadota bacterium]|nr:D-alanine--D-alanine ligase [Pseudomonadota bacterium]